MYIFYCKDYCSFTLNYYSHDVQKGVIALKLVTVYLGLWPYKLENKIISRELTMISAMTRGCLNGLSRKASVLVTKSTIHICITNSGNAKSMGLSPCHSPLDVAFIRFTQLWGVSFAVAAALVTTTASMIFFPLKTLQPSWNNDRGTAAPTDNSKKKKNNQ